MYLVVTKRFESRELSLLYDCEFEHRLETLFQGKALDRRREARIVKSNLEQIFNHAAVGIDSYPFVIGGPDWGAIPTARIEVGSLGPIISELAYKVPQIELLMPSS